MKKEKNNRNHKEIKNKSIYYGKKIEWYYFLPLILIVAIIPLITLAKVITIEGAELSHWKGGESNIDFFSYFKSIWLQGLTFLGIIIYLILLKLRKLPLKKIDRYYIPMIIYAAFVIISTITSANKTIALRGFIEQFQGVGVLLCYVIITFLIINFVNNERDVKILLKGLIFSATIVGIIGIGQYLGFDLFKSTLGKKLILPGELEAKLLDSLKFTFNKYTIYSTLYNTNFVGSFAAMLFPISIAIFLFSKGIKMRILSGIFSFITYFTWLGCNSRAGYLGCSIALIIGTILFRKEIVKSIKPLAILLVIFVITAVGMNSVSDGRVSNQFSRLNIKNEAERLENIATEETRFEDIRVDGFNFTVETNKEKLSTILEGKSLNFKDENGALLKIQNKDGEISFVDEKYKDYHVTVESKNPIIKYTIYKKQINIYAAKDGFKILGSGRRLTETEYPPYIKLFDGKEHFASSRGYIWSRSIPMLKDTFFIGYGPDNFCIYFPQDDYVGKLNAFAKNTMIVDKPHNMYLQIGINTGVISLIALLVLWLIYFIDSIKLYLTYQFNTLEEYLGAGITLAIVGYLVAGIFNDHIISVAPIFWALLGLGISINLRLKNKLKI